MSTNANIAVEQEDGSFEYIYLHWDGYPSHAGEMLKNHYNDRASAQAVVDLGDCSSLYESIECPEGHTFEDHMEGYSVFYGRDRGESGTGKEIAHSHSRMFDNSYLYIFTKDDEWVMFDGHGIITL